VPDRATYARVTATRGEGVNIDGMQFAWTQPFWVHWGGEPASRDPRRRYGLKGWSALSAKRIVLQSKMEEAANNVKFQGERAGGRVSPRSRDEIASYFVQTKTIYEKLFKGYDGRINFGEFDPPLITTLADAMLHHVGKLANKAEIDSNSVVLDLGCGQGADCFYLAQRFGCRVVGLDIAEGMLRSARSRLATDYNNFFSKIKFHGGIYPEFCKQVLAGYNPFEERSASTPLRFTHLWSTCTLFFVPDEMRQHVFADFVQVAAPGARLIIDDVLDPCARVLSESTKKLFYDRLHLTRLWQPSEYKERVQDAGFHVDEFVNLTGQFINSYGVIAKSAQQMQPDLVASYEATQKAAIENDLAWYYLIATLEPTSLATHKR